MSKKKSKREKTATIEDIYRNKNFVPPKEKNLETIFEEPKKSKDGVPILTSVRKYRRYLHFDSTQGKIQKRKVKAKRCIKKMKLENRVTRSASKANQCDDISLYILDVLGGDSSDSDMDTSQETSNSEKKDACTISSHISVQADPTVHREESGRDSENDIAQTKNYEESRTSNLDEEPSESVSKETNNATTENTKKESLLKSPRNSCCVT